MKKTAERTKITSKAKKISAGLSAAFLSILIMFITAEILTRLTGYESLSNIYIPSTDPEIYYKLKPGSDTTWCKKRIRINYQGLRDKEYPLEKSESCFRIWGSGDSMMLGAGLDLEDIYVKILEESLNSNPPSEKYACYEVINGSHDGFNTSQQFAYFKKYGLLYDPDMILICYSLNDPEMTPSAKNQPGELRLWFPNTVRAVLGWSRFFYFVLDKYYIVRHNHQVKKGEGRWPHGREKDVLFALHEDSSRYWLQCREALRKFSNLGKKHDIPILLVIQPMLDYDGDFYPYRPIHKQVAKTCADLGISVLDLAFILEEKKPASLCLSPKDPHFNEAGHQIIAEAIYRYLKSEGIPSVEERRLSAKKDKKAQGE